MHGRGPEHRTFGTDLCVWEIASLLKMGQGLADRSEGHRSFGRIRIWDPIEAPDDVIDITALARVWEGS
jgi:hypothetical protein